MFYTDVPLQPGSCLLVTSSGALDCVYSLWYNALKKLPVGDQDEFHLILITSRQHRRCIIPQAVNTDLVLLRMGEIIARNMLS